MKKFLAIILAMVMLIGILPTVSFSAAENEYVPMDVNWGYEVKITDESQMLYYSYTVEKSGVYSFYSFVTDDDPYMYCYDENHNELGFDDSSGFGENFAYNKYLEEGKTYYFEIGARFVRGDTAKFGIEIRDVSSSVQNMVMHEDYRVLPGADYDREYFAFTPETDGYYAFMSTGGALMNVDAVMYDSDWNYIREDDRSGGKYDFYLPYYLEAGKTYYYTSLSDHYMMKDQYHVRVQDATPILDINVVSYPDKMTYYTGYEDDTADFSGLELELTDSNGKVYQYSYDEDTYIRHTAVYVSLQKDEDSGYYISIDAGLAHEEIKVKISDCPVESIEVYSASDVILYENMSGSYAHAVGGADMFYYRFDLPSDLMMKIKYKDGTSVVTSYFEPYDGMKFKKVSDQYYEPMSFGENAVRLSYYDIECDFIVNVVETPVDYFTVYRAPYTQYVYTVNGNDPTQGDYFEFYPKLDGIGFTAHFKDGTTQSFNDTFTDPYYIFTTGNGSLKPLDAHRVYAPGKTEISFTYCNKEVTYEAVVLGPGDCEADGVVNIMDATKIQRYLTQTTMMTTAETMVADFDGDGQISIFDATAIQRKLVNL